MLYSKTLVTFYDNFFGMNQAIKQYLHAIFFSLCVPQLYSFVHSNFFYCSLLHALLDSKASFGMEGIFWFLTCFFCEIKLFHVKFMRDSYVILVFKRRVRKHCTFCSTK
jgi:hypothetical protein